MCGIAGFFSNDIKINDLKRGDPKLTIVFKNAKRMRSIVVKLKAF